MSQIQLDKPRNRAQTETLSGKNGSIERLARHERVHHGQWFNYPVRE